ncbi:MAG: MBL fold metallo-hydrolase [Thermoprotei archaeon]
MGLPNGVTYLGDLGRPRVLVGYFVDGGSEAAIIETGPSRFVDEYLSKATSIVKGGRLGWSLVSHVHLDHAGGAWRAVELRPNLKVGVYEKGYKHLVDPTRLIESARQALGSVYDVWGEIRPTPPSSLVALKDGEAVSIGSLTARLIAAPGHAPHSSVWYLEENRVLFSGDALGIYVDGGANRFVWPTTPPPTYDYDLAVATISKIRKLKIDAICFPHYGYSTDVDEAFRLIDEGFNAWFEVTEKATSDSWSTQEILEQLSKRLPITPLLRDEYLRSLILMDIRGMVDYHLRKHGGKKPD